MRPGRAAPHRVAHPLEMARAGRTHPREIGAPVLGMPVSHLGLRGSPFPASTAAEGPTRPAAECDPLAVLLPEVEIGDHVEQNHAEGDEARDDAEPREYEDALVPVGRRRGDSKDEVESPEYFCEKVDHGALRRCEAIGARVQYDIGPTSFSTSTVSTMTMAS